MTSVVRVLLLFSMLIAVAGYSRPPFFISGKRGPVINTSAAPVVNAGNSQAITLPANTAILSGTVTQISGAVVTSTLWSQVSGPASAKIAMPGSLTTTISNLGAAGTYVFQLRATNNMGLYGISTVMIIVNAINSPGVSAGHSQTITLPVTKTALTGAVVPVSGTMITSVIWTQLSGPITANIVSPNSLTTLITGLTTPGTYLFQLMVTDNKGLSASSAVMITVNDAFAPKVNAGADQVIILPVTTAGLAGTAIPASGSSITSIMWSQLSGPVAVTIASPGTLATGISGLTVTGTYVFQIKATDNNGFSASTTVAITVKSLAPIVGAGSPQTIMLPTSTAGLTGTASPVSGTAITGILWSQVSGPKTATITAPNSLVTTVSGLTLPGIYVFQLKVTNNKGISTTATVAITVKSPVPTVGAGSPQTIVLPLSTAALHGTATPASGNTIASILWSQLSGPKAAMIVPPNSLTTTVSGLTMPGIYIFQLKVTDNKGNSATATVAITVKSSVLPIVNPGAPQTIILPVSTAILKGTAAPVGGTKIASVHWSQVGGPKPAMIAAPNSLTTAISGLTAPGTYTFMLKVTDNKGNSGTGTIAITVKPSLLPIVNAGLPQTITLPVSAATLKGAATPQGGAMISSVFWSQVSGPKPAMIAMPNSLTTTISGLTVPGTYTFMLKVTDNKGNSNTGTVAITIKPSLASPVVNAGAMQTIILPVSTTALKGMATPQGGAKISSVLWSQLSGPKLAMIATPGNLTTAISGLTVPGTYTFQLKATDNYGKIGTGTVMIVIKPMQIPPVVNAGAPQTIILPVNAVMLTGVTTPQGGAKITSVVWSQVSGPAIAKIITPNSLVTLISGLITPGTYTFQLKATDNNGKVGTGTVIITVKPALLPPIVNAGAPQVITLPVSSVSLMGTATPQGGATISSVLWSQVSGPVPAIIGAPVNLTTLLTGLITPGVYTFQLKATDNNGKAGIGTVVITVKPSPLPIVNAGLPQAVTLPNTIIAVQGTATGVGGAVISSILWTQVSGPAPATIILPNSLATPIINLIAPGIYVFQLRAMDNMGNSAMATVTITVSPGNGALVVCAGDDPVVTLPDNNLILSGNCSQDSVAPIIQYNWTQLSGPAATIIEPGSPATFLQNLQPGICWFQLTATDAMGNTGTAAVRVVVLPAPPVTSASKNAATGLIPPAASLGDLQVAMSPNPVQGMLRVQFGDNDTHGPATIMIYNINGSVALTKQIQASGGRQEVMIDVSSLQPGMYPVVVKVGNHTGRQMVMKQ